MALPVYGAWDAPYMAGSGPPYDMIRATRRVALTYGIGGGGLGEGVRALYHCP